MTHTLGIIDANLSRNIFIFIVPHNYYRLKSILYTMLRQLSTNAPRALSRIASRASRPSTLLPIIKPSAAPVLAHQSRAYHEKVIDHVRTTDNSTIWCSSDHRYEVF